MREARVANVISHLISFWFLVHRTMSSVKVLCHTMRGDIAFLWWPPDFFHGDIGVVLFPSTPKSSAGNDVGSDPSAIFYHGVNSFNFFLPGVRYQNQMNLLLFTRTFALRGTVHSGGGKVLVMANFRRRFLLTHVIYNTGVCIIMCMCVWKGIVMLWRWFLLPRTVIPVAGMRSSGTAMGYRVVGFAHSGISYYYSNPHDFFLTTSGFAGRGSFGLAFFKFVWCGNNVWAVSVEHFRIDAIKVPAVTWKCSL